MTYEDYDYDEAIALKLVFTLSSDGIWFVEVSEGYSGSSTSFGNGSPLELMDGALEWAQSTVTVSGADDFAEAMEALDQLQSEDFETRIYVEPRVAALLLESTR